MPRLFLLLSMLCFSASVSGQTRTCRIRTARTRTAIPNVAVSGLQSEEVWVSDSAGLVQLSATDGGPFRFSRIGFNTRILKPDSGSEVWDVILQPLPYALEGVTVLSPLARFRRDSAFNHSFFQRQLADAKFKPGKRLIWIRSPRGIEAGIEWSGLFYNLALAASGKKTQYRRFARELHKIEAGKFSAIRYTTSLVSELTGLEEDAAMAFIASHPLDEDFLRAASELELKMRVREMYRSAGG